MNSRRSRRSKPRIPSAKASAWLKEAFASAMLCDRKQALSDAETLIRLLRGQRVVKKTALLGFTDGPTGDPVWRCLGDMHLFNMSVARADIQQLGRSQGWNVSVVKWRTIGKWRAMAMGRLGPQDGEPSIQQ